MGWGDGEPFLDAQALGMDLMPNMARGWPGNSELRSTMYIPSKPLYDLVPIKLNQVKHTIMVSSMSPILGW